MGPRRDESRGAPGEVPSHAARLHALFGRSLNGFLCRVARELFVVCFRELRRLGNTSQRNNRYCKNCIAAASPLPPFPRWLHIALDHTGQPTYADRFSLFSSLHLICLLRLDLAHVLLVFKLFSWSRTYINTVHQPPSSRSRIGPRTLHHARLSQASESFQASIMSAEPRIDHPAFPPSIYSPTATRNTSVSQPKAPAGPILISRFRSLGIMTDESRRRNVFTDMVLNICRVSRKRQ